MLVRDEPIQFAADGRQLTGTFIAPARKSPGVLFVHGWAGNQEQYLARAREIAAFGCVCLTFNLSANMPGDSQHETVTREDNLRDIIAAYELLAGRRDAGDSAIAVIASSYGAYLSAILTSMRPVRWLALRAPALYQDADWNVPKRKLKREELTAYRRQIVAPEENRALAACAKFEGDVLVVESERDNIVPHPVITNYRTAFKRAHSLTYRVLEAADHGLSRDEWQHAYTSMLVGWAREMFVGAN
jgi:hypothetical protein